MYWTSIQVSEFVEEFCDGCSDTKEFMIYGNECRYEVTNDHYIIIHRLPRLPFNEAFKVLKIIEEYWKS